MSVVPPLGATVEPGSSAVRFALFAEPASSCAVRLFDARGAALATHPLRSAAPGYFTAQVDGIGHGALYQFVVDGRELPDPFARFLPHGVHGPAMVVVPSYRWRHGRGVDVPPGDQVIYELHVGTFTPAGTYAGVARRLPELASLGITTIELMPIAAFPGQRGWGYEGVALYAPFAPYGTPDELRALIDQAHGLGLSMILDVVYNHFGPCGNYLGSFSADLFSRELHNAWGQAPHYPHPVMRRLLLDNARYWLDELRFDGLRLDATHAILDPAPRHLLRDLVDVAAALRPRKQLYAEDERNEAALLTRDGVDALWADDFHHAVRVTVTGERDGYYAAFQPGAREVAETIDQGWRYQGQVYPPTGKRRGTSAAAIPASALVYCIQNHDQVGNRAFGDRLHHAIAPETYRAVSMLLLFLPMTPLLFMGQEWAASSPFLFFTDHDEELGRKVCEGRRAEFRGFAAFADPAACTTIPDPQDADTFRRSGLNWEERSQGEHARVLDLYRALLRLRRADPVLRGGTRAGLSARAAGEVLMVRRAADRGVRHLLLNFGGAPVPYADLPVATERMTLLLDSDGRGERGPVLAPGQAVILAEPDREPPAGG